MKELFINTSTSDLVISIVINNEIKYLYVNNSQSDMSSKIMPIIDEAFNKCNIKINDINTIYVTNGPGSFTGIRIGLTFAKVTAWALKIKVVPISSLELMASGFNKNVLPVIDARRGYVFAGLYDKDLNAIMKDEYIDFVELNNKLKEKGYDNNYEIISNDFEYVKPNYDILKIIKKHRDDKGVNPHTLNPNYLKLTEAEEKIDRK